ncbi:MAG: LLM class flavin-dependent oxidoreductase [Rhizomicrobium sp.]
MPNRWLDPDATNQVYHKYFDIVQAVDDLGLDVMFNEHHETMSNLNAVMPLTMAIAARETKKCRILALGNPAANRPDPVRLATEMAMIDVVSHGRLDCGFIKGVFYEMSATNARPTDLNPRLYEAIELIVKAWTSHDGPFNWEGEFFHHRQVNIVPRPYQQPHPPIWVTAISPGSTSPIAERGYTMATMNTGTEACAKLFDFYRQTYAQQFGAPPHPDKLAYCGFAFVGDTDEEALKEAPKIQDFLKQSFRVPKGQLDVPGYLDVNARAAMLKAEAEKPGSVFNFDAVGRSDPEKLVEAGIGFYGNPDSVFEQLKAFFHAVGGFGNFLGMFQGSTMSYALTTKSLRLFAEEVLPRFRSEVYEPWLKEHGLKRLLRPKDRAARERESGVVADANKGDVTIGTTAA